MPYSITEQLALQLENMIGFSKKKAIKIKKNPSNQTQTKATILIVDDEDSMREFATTFLEIGGYKVLSANSVANAKIILQSDLSVSLILSDLAMPNEDGFEVMKFVRSNFRFAHIPVIVISSHSNPDIVKRAKEEGAKDYLVKPYTSEILLLRVNKVFQDSTTYILLVTEDELEYSLLKRTLNTDNYKLILKKNGAEAFKEIKRVEFDIIISDLVLNDMTGIDLLLKISDLGIETPLMFIECVDFNITNEMVYAIGGHGYIRKPFNNTEILKILRTVVLK